MLRILCGRQMGGIHVPDQVIEGQPRQSLGRELDSVGVQVLGLPVAPFLVGQRLLAMNDVHGEPGLFEEEGDGVPGLVGRQMPSVRRGEIVSVADAVRRACCEGRRWTP